MIESTNTSTTILNPLERQSMTKRRGRQADLDGFEPSNSLEDDDEKVPANEQILNESSKPNLPIPSSSVPQSLSPLNFRIARPPLPSTGNSPSTGKSQLETPRIMPGFYSSIAGTQNSRRLLISPARRQRLLRQLSDHGGIGNVLLNDSQDGVEEGGSEQKNVCRKASVCMLDFMCCALQLTSQIAADRGTLYGGGNIQEKANTEKANTFA
jgi:hypothetical protein